MRNFSQICSTCQDKLSLCLGSTWLCCVWSFVEVTALMEVIICVGDSFWILKLCHLEQLSVVLPLHFEEIFTVRVIMSHCTGSCMPSSVLSNSWRLFLTKHFVLLADFVRSLLPVIIADNITNWCSRPIWPSVRMSFFGQVNWLLLNGKIETRQLIFSSVSSVGCLGSSCRRSGPQ